MQLAWSCTHVINCVISNGNPPSKTAMSGNDFWTSGTGTGNGKFHSHFSGTGIQVENSNPIFGNGNGNEKFHSRLSGRELEDGIPGNSREFPGNPGNSRDREFPGYYYCKEHGWSKDR